MEQLQIHNPGPSSFLMAPSIRPDQAASDVKSFKMELGFDKLLREKSQDTVFRDWMPDLAEDENFRLRDKLAKAKPMVTRVQTDPAKREGGMTGGGGRTRAQGQEVSKERQSRPEVARR